MNAVDIKIISGIIANLFKVALPVGTIRHRKDGKYQKMQNGEWEKIGEGHGKNFELHHQQSKEGEAHFLANILVGEGRGQHIFHKKVGGMEQMQTDLSGGGITALFKMGDDKMTLTRFAVHVNYRGRAWGAGMLHGLLQRAHQNGIKNIQMKDAKGDALLRSNKLGATVYIGDKVFTPDKGEELKSLLKKNASVRGNIMMGTDPSGETVQRLNAYFKAKGIKPGQSLPPSHGAQPAAAPAPSPNIAVAGTPKPMKTPGAKVKMPALPYHKPIINKSGVSDAQLNKSIKNITGKNATAKTMENFTKLMGAGHMPGKLKIIGAAPATAFSPPAIRTIFRSNDGKFEWDFTFRKLGNGKKDVHFNLCHNAAKGNGQGSKAVQGIVEAARKLGVEQLSLHAAGAGVGRWMSTHSMNGYYTWPQFGFNDNISISQIKNHYNSYKSAMMSDTEGPKLSPAQVSKELQRISKIQKPTVQDLIKTKNGNILWRRFGHGMYEMKFDTAKGSASAKKFAQYIKAKGANK